MQEMFFKRWCVMLVLQLIFISNKCLCKGPSNCLVSRLSGI